MPKLPDNSPHVSDLDLVRFADGEMPAKSVTTTETHLRVCNKCRTRLNQLKAGAGAYDEFHTRFVQSGSEDLGEWPNLHARLEELNDVNERPMPRAGLWWTAAALASFAAVVVWFHYHPSPTYRMQQVLARAVEIRTPLHRRVRITAHGQTWYRAATLEAGIAGGKPTAVPSGLDDTRALFVKANYSWDDPLSARSFAAWRNRLPQKRDQVLSIQDSSGKHRFYRLQTETPAGVLRSAALTLQADTLNPVQGAFRFEHRDEVTIDDAGEMPAEVETRKNRPPGHPPEVKEVGPEEELRVFAALNAIGADVGKPLTVDLDASKRYVLVAGVGLSANSERQIRQALAPIPNVALRFSSRPPLVSGNQRATSDDRAPANAAPLRQTLEARVGGALRFQEITDEALDSSSAILARAHALYVLAQKFPASVTTAFTPAELDVLGSLRLRHSRAIGVAAAGLKRALRPLLASPEVEREETQTPLAASWEVSAAQLYEQARTLDDSLGRILAGSYSHEQGQDILSKLPGEVRNVESLAQSEQDVR